MQHALNATTSQINIRHLMAIYLVLPAVLVLYIVDRMYFGSIRMLMPYKPEDLAFWIYIFGMPHVFASFFLLADKEYLRHFSRRLWVSALILLALPPLVAWGLGWWVLQVIFTCMIVYHTVAQQFGVALMVGKRRPDLLHKINTFLGSVAGVAIYLLIYADGDLLTVVLHNERLWRDVCHVLVAIVVLLSTWEIVWHDNRNWRIYMGLNALLLVTMDLLMSQDLTFLIVVTGRVVHEFTAWQIYMHHDHNRNKTVRRNWIYARLSWVKITPYWLGMLLAFGMGIAYTALMNSTGSQALWFLTISFSLYHYWIEGFIWKGNSPPKHQLRVA